MRPLQASRCNVTHFTRQTGGDMRTTNNTCPWWLQEKLVSKSECNDVPQLPQQRGMPRCADMPLSMYHERPIEIMHKCRLHSASAMHIRNPYFHLLSRCLGLNNTKNHDNYDMNDSDSRKHDNTNNKNERERVNNLRKVLVIPTICDNAAAPR
jgi:hypothetical protein